MPIGSLMNAGLIDELRLVIRPVVSGAGKPLFKDVTNRQRLTLTDLTRLDQDLVRVTYRLK